jgi:hypothetical protein
MGSNQWGVDQLTNYTMCTAARKAAVDARAFRLVAVSGYRR